MKSLAYLFFAITLFLLSAAFHKPVKDKGEVLLTCRVNSCEKVDSIYLYEFNGVNFKAVKAAPTTDYTTYQFRMPTSGPRFYYVGLANNMRPLILGTEENVTLQGACPSFQTAQTSGSNLNVAYENTKNAINELKNEMGALLRQLQVSTQQQDTKMIETVHQQFAELDRKCLHLLDSLKKTSPYLAKVVALNTYISYVNNGAGYENEIDYFAKNYFRFADWSDPDYNYLPWVYEGLKGYAQTLTLVGLPDANVKNYIDLLLNKIPENSRTYQLALGGVMAALMTKKHPLFGVYAQRFVEKYKKTEPEAVAQIESQLKMSASFIVGMEAPDFTMNTPDGQSLALSHFKGKILLVDFWASWCGPCRRENPHVVEAYNKYHGKGFEVLGVSLDRTREPWLAAIEKDGLIWHHVSDLKGWQNEAAQLYGVSSIPHTVLLDREGKIIARNLRGQMLDDKLKEIFGE